MSADQLAARGVFRIGDVLGGAWRILTGNLLFFHGVPVLIYAAISAVFVASSTLVGRAGSEQLVAWASFGLATVIELILYAIGQAVVLIGAFQRLCGEPLRVGVALRRSLARALPLVVLAVLWSIVIGLCVIVATFVVPLMIFRAGTGMLLAYVLVPIALVPAAMVFVVWVVVVPACVVEGLGPIASMLRSFALTKGARWKIFGIVLLAGLLFLADALVDRIVDPVSPTFAPFVSAAWIVLVMAFWNCIIIMIYHGLRVAREGIAPGQLAAVFD
jgi:hypothetical protein